MVRENTLFVSSELGESVMCVNLDLEEQWSPLLAPNDNFCEQLTAESLSSKLSRFYAKRRKMRNEEDIESG